MNEAFLWSYRKILTAVLILLLISVSFNLFLICVFVYLCIKFTSVT